MINNRQFGVGPDRTDEVDDEVGDRNARGTRRGGRNRYISYYFLFSTLLISSSRLSPFPFVYSTITGGAWRGVTGPTRAAQQLRTGQGAGGREGEVEGQAEEGSGGGQGAETGGRRKK